MHTLYDLIAAATSENAAVATAELLQMTREQYVDFINGLDHDELASALQTHGGIPYFVFPLATIYVWAGATRSFPKILAELLYEAVFLQKEGAQEFLERLNQSFQDDWRKVARYLWGLCENVKPFQLTSFLKSKNSSPLMLFNWLQLAIRGNKQIVKELFQIFGRIAEQNMKQNPKVDYSDVVRALIAKQEYLLFHETNGVFAVILEKGYVGNLLNLFEVDWDFKPESAELTLVREFLRKRPINASWLLPTDYMSAECSRRLIGHVMNLPDLLNPSGRLTDLALLLPANVVRIAKFVYFSDHFHLQQILSVDQFAFDTIVVPGKYTVYDVLYFFMNLHLRRNPALFSRMRGALKTYGNKLLPEDLKEIQRAIMHFDEVRQMEASIFAAFMCIERQEAIHCVQDHILLLKAILGRNDAHTLQVTPSSAVNLQEIVCALRINLPDFLLNAKVLSVNRMSFLPVVQVDPVSQPVVAFLQSHPTLFFCLLQLLMVSNTLDELWAKMVQVMEFIGQQAATCPPNDVQFQLNLVEMFNILHACFCKFNVKMQHFCDHVHPLLPKNPNNSVFKAFIADARFQELTLGVRDEHKVAKMEEACATYCTLHKTTMDHAQRELGCVLFYCCVCTSNFTQTFMSIFDCGHAICTGCSENLRYSNCPNCRADITKRTRPSFEIRFRKDPEDPSEQSAESAESAEKMQRQE
jgi:hypothetical protein